MRSVHSDLIACRCVAGHTLIGPHASPRNRWHRVLAAEHRQAAKCSTHLADRIEAFSNSADLGLLWSMAPKVGRLWLCKSTSLHRIQRYPAGFQTAIVHVRGQALP